MYVSGPLHILVTYLLDNVIVMGGETAFFFHSCDGKVNAIRQYMESNEQSCKRTIDC